MRFFAAYVLRGYWQAALTTAACALLSLLLPPFGYLSSAALALVTLAKGPKAGLVTCGIAALFVAAMALLAFGTPVLAFGLLLIVWLPAWLLSFSLGQWNALGLSVLLSIAVGFVLVTGAYVVVDAPAQLWQDYYLDDLLPAMKQAGLAVEVSAELEQRLYSVARLMTGALTAVMLFGLLLSVLLARYWQAVLQQPGAFGAEFRSLRLGMSAAALAGLLLLASLIGDGTVAELSANLLLVSAVGFVLQGLALIHAAAYAFSAQVGWLVGFYVLLILLPQVGLMVALFGWLDNLVQFRRRLPQR
ncbi:MAG: hypothetical protein AMJ69_01375 [Gammaproteobacteria bacterium SG8_47]|nr:MAG: hypothetical protein AMJ69_01375 [Gammaproteobacteria bacterium SG8_47]